jgi:hypothetical protein
MSCELSFFLFLFDPVWFISYDQANEILNNEENKYHHNKDPNSLLRLNIEFVLFSKVNGKHFSRIEVK